MEACRVLSVVICSCRAFVEACENFLPECMSRIDKADACNLHVTGNHLGRSLIFEVEFIELYLRLRE